MSTLHKVINDKDQIQHLSNYINADNDKNKIMIMLLKLRI